MTYSLIRAREKEILSLDTKMWLFFIAMLTALFVVAKFIITTYIVIVETAAVRYAESQTYYEAEISKVQLESAVVLQDIESVSRTMARNKAIKNSLKSLLDIVPDQVHLTEMIIDENSLQIRGYSPSKDIFNYLLRPPLESIFATTDVSFYPTGNGWLIFYVKCESPEGFVRHE